MEAGPPPPPPAPVVANASRCRWGRSATSGRCSPHDDRIQAFLLLPRDEAEDFFFALPARDQAEVVLGMPAREQRSWVRSLPPDDAADLIQAGPPTRSARRCSCCSTMPTRREVTALLAYSEDNAGGLMNPRYIRAAPRDDGRRGDQLRAQADARAAAHDLLRLRARRRAAPARAWCRSASCSPPRSRTRVAEIMKRQVTAIPEQMDQETVSHKFAAEPPGRAAGRRHAGQHEGHRDRRRRRRRRPGRGHRGHAEGRRRRGPRRAVSADRHVAA